MLTIGMPPLWCELRELSYKMPGSSLKLISRGVAAAMALTGPSESRGPSLKPSYTRKLSDNICSIEDGVVCLYEGLWLEASRSLFHSVERYLEMSLIGGGSSKTMIIHWIPALISVFNLK